MRLIDPKAQHLDPGQALTRRERWTLTSIYIWILLQNVLLIAFLKFIEHKDKAWFDVVSGYVAAFVYRISLFFSGLG